MNANDNQMEIQVLQPEIDSQIKQVTLGELKSWITDGKLQPNHKVRIKNLSWLEADKIPAFKNLFEAKKNSSTQAAKVASEEKRSAQQAELSSLQGQSIFSPPVPKAFKTETIKVPTPPVSTLSQIATMSISDLLARGKQEIDESAHKSEQPAPSSAFKKFEEKATARAKKAEQRAADKAKEAEAKIEDTPELAEPKSAETSRQAETKQAEAKTSNKPKQSEPKSKPVQIVAKARKKSSYVKQAAVFLIGSVFMGMLAFGGSYLWVYQLKTPIEIDEKVLPELSVLEDKITSDKLELRLKAATIEQKIKEVKKNDPPIERLDVAQEIAKLDNQHNTQRKSLIENYRNKLDTDNLYSTFYLSFAVLMVLFLLNRVFYGKTEQVIESQHSSKSPNIQKSPASVVRNASSEDSENINRTDPGRASHLTSPSDKTETSDEIIQLADEVVRTAEGFGTGDAPKVNNCLQHKETAAKFYCDGCSNYFCEECPKTFEEKENCCPFCQTACKSADEAPSEAASKPQPAKDPKKKTPVNLLDIGKDSNFTMHEYKDERTRKLGIIPAFVISLLLSGSISILWVYNLAPYLEKRGKEVAQNVAPNGAQKSEKGNTAAMAPNQATTDNVGNTNASQSANQNTSTANGQTNTATAAIDPNNDICMDPETKREFKCEEEKNEQLREALRDHARVAKSAQKAQTEVKEKSNLIMSLFSSEARDEVNKANQKNVTADPEADARKEKDKQLLIKVFAGSFLVIFGLLLSTRLFHKDPNLE